MGGIWSSLFGSEPPRQKQTDNFNYPMHYNAYDHSPRRYDFEVRNRISRQRFLPAHEPQHIVRYRGGGDSENYSSMRRPESRLQPMSPFGESSSGSSSYYRPTVAPPRTNSGQYYLRPCNFSTLAEYERYISSAKYILAYRQDTFLSDGTMCARASELVRMKYDARRYFETMTSIKPETKSLLKFSPTKNVSYQELLRCCEQSDLIQIQNRTLLKVTDSKEREIISQVERGTQNKLKVISVHENINIYMSLTFQLKKAELCSLHGNFDVSFLFHGTPAKNKEIICERNFDWRLHGTNKGHIFGCGVSFSPLPSYASHYSDESSQHENIMFLAEVLHANVAVGASYMKIPPSGFDTTAKPDSKVIVKYDDHTYYPKYVITYYGVIPDIKDIYKKKKVAKKVAKNMLSEEELRFNCSVDDVIDSICECLEQIEDYNSKGLLTKRQVASILPGMRDLLSEVVSFEDSRQEDLSHRWKLLAEYEKMQQTYRSRFYNYTLQVSM